MGQDSNEVSQDNASAGRSPISVSVDQAERRKEVPLSHSPGNRDESTNQLLVDFNTTSSRHDILNSIVTKISSHV